MKSAPGVMAGRGASLMSRAKGVAAGVALAWMVLQASPAWGQWSGTNPVYTMSKVGIGTSTPSEMLTVYKASGAVTSRTQSGSGLVDLAHDGSNSWLSYTSTGSMIFWDNRASTARMLITANGNVGIGTGNPQYKLAVNGTIGAKDVIVTNTGWADYVFRPGYRLRPLSEVDEFIREKGHLPEIPSEAEVKASGVSVGEMQAKLLAKIEELTLHMIRQEQENGALRERLAALESRAAGR